METINTTEARDKIIELMSRGQSIGCTEATKAVMNAYRVLCLNGRPPKNINSLSSTVKNYIHREERNKRRRDNAKKKRSKSGSRRLPSRALVPSLPTSGIDRWELLKSVSQCIDLKAPSKTALMHLIIDEASSGR